MNFADDPRDLSHLGRKKSSGYSVEYTEEETPLPPPRQAAPLVQQPQPVPPTRPEQTPPPQRLPTHRPAQNPALPAQNSPLPAPPQQQRPVAQPRPGAQPPAAQQPPSQQQTPSPQQRPAAQPPRQQHVPVPASPSPAAIPQPAPPPQAKLRITEEAPRKAVDRSQLAFVTDSSSVASVGKDVLLATEGLVKIYGHRTVVNGVNINVRKGEIVGLLGPNGAGKTTSFYMIVGLVPPNDGKVLFNGQDVTRLPMFKRARLGMGYLPQEESIFRKLTVEENIMAVMQTMNYSKKEKQQRCDELLERFSITHIRRNIAMACSGGEKRRVTIARSLVPNPSLIMLDEPFAGVDPIAVNEIQGIVENLRREGLAILLTDHNARQTLELVDRAYLIYEGRVLREGSRDFLVNDPVARELYLGDRFSL